MWPEDGRDCRWRTLVGAVVRKFRVGVAPKLLCLGTVGRPMRCRSKCRVGLVRLKEEEREKKKKKKRLGFLSIFLFKKIKKEEKLL